MSELTKAVESVATMGAVVTFAWGVYLHFASQRAQAESRRIEAAKPFLERQLRLYTDATQAAATIATSENPADVAAAKARFWSLFWGELALVEDRSVEAAMVGLGRALEGQEPPPQIRQLSLALAHACRGSLAQSWGVREWRNRHQTSQPQ